MIDMRGHEQTTGEGQARPPDPLLDRAVRLFEFLQRVQQITETPVRHVDTYRKGDGAVVWFHTVPDHSAAWVATAGDDLDPDEPLLIVDRVPPSQPPLPPPDLAAWVAGPLDQPERQPELRESATIPDENGREPDTAAHVRTLRLEDEPAVRAAFGRWLDEWRIWASHERDVRPVRELYAELFRAQLTALNAPEEWEIVVGVGALAWHPPKHEPVVRHILTRPVQIDFDDDSGRITVSLAEPAGLTVELEMLSHDRWPNPALYQQLRSDAEKFDSHPLDRDAAGKLARRLTHAIDSEGRYDDEDHPRAPTEGAVCAFAPALILRKRTQQGLVEIFQRIKQQLEERGSVPAGLRVLLDPDQAPASADTVDPTSGAWIQDGDEVYLPLPVNQSQVEVIRRVDRRALTLVQGPPGTGKTHTAAVLISHLLAQGKRVLVTAQTDRALQEVRGKLPEDIRDLSVSVVGSGRKELAELRVAVRKLSEAAGEYDSAHAQRVIDEAVEQIDELRRTKAELGRQLLEIREAETVELEHGGYRGTLAAIAARHADVGDQYRWLATLATVDPIQAPPLTSTECADLLRLLRDDSLTRDESEAHQELPLLEHLPAPDDYARLVDAANDACVRANAHDHLRTHESYRPIATLSTSDRHALRDRVDALAARIDQLNRRPEQWLAPALADTCAGKPQTWRSRHDQIAQLVSETAPLVERLGPVVEVRVQGDARLLVPQAQAVLALMKTGKPLKLDPATGKPKQGLLAPKPVKEATALFDKVLVDGVPPTTVSALETFLTFVEAAGCLDALDKAWPATVTIPPEDSLAERLAWHVAEHAVLAEVIDLSPKLADEDRWLQELGISNPDWSDPAAVRGLSQLADSAETAAARERAETPLADLANRLAVAGRWDDAAPALRDLSSAASRRDPENYRQSHGRLRRLFEVRVLAARRDELLAILRSAAPQLAEELATTADEPAWDNRLNRFEHAWAWCATSAWIRSRSAVDVNALQASYAEVEDRIRREVTRLAAMRAWSKAVERLGPTQRADLTQYAQLVADFGAGTTKYAARKKTNIRDAMRRCRAAVPVWIMPLYRIAESLVVDADLFDVVVVDEASQAGLNATFLQYLAPKMVVIGDDKQVSPSAVGVDQAPLQQLANQYLYDDRYKASWENPKRSLFDEARMRFQDLVTLVEHRRCVPDIIGFSNRIAYEPDNIRLIPIRETGSDALDPIVPVLVTDGYTRGNGEVNPAEVDAVVEQIEKCLSDACYDGMTFGVISLKGNEQARVIERTLLDRIDHRDWQARDLRCGIAADFQGAERDVMFLSMVTAREEGRRLHPLTGSTYVQRFNVAASRAKEQMWVFHSVALHELANHKDMRWELLDYCYGVARRRAEQGEGHSTFPVPEGRLVEPFDSLFEQRVHNRIFDRGYTVIPQYPVEGYKIDLVVVGARGKLAVECDGDRWHGPDRHEHDLARQRELQRCGWRFFRVPQSEFVIDSNAALAPLWELLDRYDIYPGGSSEPAAGERKGAGPPATEPSMKPEPLLSYRASHQVAPRRDQLEDDQGTHPATTENAVSLAFSDAVPHHRQETGPSESHTPISVARMEEGRNVLNLAPYPVWDTRHVFPNTKNGTLAGRIEALRRIVEVEGPILGHRLYQLYVRSAGGQRVGKEIRRLLNSTSNTAVSKGILKAENLLGEPGQILKTFRLPGQPEVDLRERGPRTLSEVPPGELIAVMRALKLVGQDEEAWFRAVLDAYGSKRLTEPTKGWLRRHAQHISDP
jgi:very-short-patch-repair endonuclease